MLQKVFVSDTPEIKIVKIKYNDFCVQCVMKNRRVVFLILP